MAQIPLNLLSGGIPIRQIDTLQCRSRTRHQILWPIFIQPRPSWVLGIQPGPSAVPGIPLVPVTQLFMGPNLEAHLVNSWIRDFLDVRNLYMTCWVVCFMCLFYGNKFLCGIATPQETQTKGVSWCRHSWLCQHFESVVFFCLSNSSVRVSE